MNKQNTYWNQNGKFQSLYDEVSELIPHSGECDASKPALEKLRRAANLYYDHYNNNLCNNGEADFRAVFGCSRFDSEGVEEKLDSLILAAALENGWELGKVSKSISFFVTLTENERLEILEAARLALADNDCLDRMDMADEYAAPLQMKVEKFMQ